jgi:hypothetical protein
MGINPERPRKLQGPKPKYEATALHSHPIIGYPNSSNGQYELYNGTPDR